MKLAFCASAVLWFSLPSVGQSIRTDSSSAKKNENLVVEVGLNANGTTGKSVPFWMRANKFGSIPLDGASTSLTGTLIKEYTSKVSRKKFDWGAGLDLRLNAGKKIQLVPLQAYVKGRLGFLQIKVGRSKDVSGLVDSTLSTGSFALSGNALGIPKIELSVPEFQDLPFLNGLIALKGSFSHGWMGNVPIQYERIKGTSVPTYFHNASLHGRFGMPHWKIKIYSGINHEVLWGSDKEIFGDQYSLTLFDAFFHVVSGKKYVKDGLKRDISKIGNHLGAVDLGFDIDLKNVYILGYRQFFYEKGALGYLANIKDGLTGVSIRNKKQNNSYWHWNKFLLEVFYSGNQAGERNSKKTPSGPEYYYNHAVYQEGYSYKGLGLGNPLITRSIDARQGLPNDPINYFINNRVLAMNFGAEGSIQSWTYLIKMTYSQNYGEYRTSDVPYWLTGARHERNPVYGIFKKTNQFSGIVEISKPLRHNIFLGGVLAVDQGRLLNNSFGGALRLTKKW